MDKSKTKTSKIKMLQIPVDVEWFDDLKKQADKNKRSLPNQVKENIMKVNGVSDVDLKLVWEPPWSKDKMSEAAKLELNL